MVEFGKTLAQSKRPEWADSYLNYDRLKQILRQQQKQRRRQRNGEEDPARSPIANNFPTNNDDGDQLHHHNPHPLPHRRSQSHSALTGITAAKSPSHGHGHGGTDNNKLIRHHPFDGGSLRRLWSGGVRRSRHDPATSNPIVPEEESLFRRALDQEIEKVVLFSLEQQGQLSKELSQLSPQRQSCLEQVARMWQEFSTSDYGSATATATATVTRHLIMDTYRAYQEMAQHVLDYVQFVEMNVVAVRKILKKHDKKLHSHAAADGVDVPPLSETYLNHKNQRGAFGGGGGGGGGRGGMDTHLDSFYGFGPGLSALVATLRRAFAELHQAESFMLLVLTTNGSGTTTTTTIPNSRSAPLLLVSQEDDNNLRVSSASSPSPLSSPKVSSATLAKAVSLITSYSHPAHPVLLEDTPLQAIASDDEEAPPPPPPPPSTSLLLAKPFMRIQTEITMAREPLLEEIQAARSRLQESTSYVKIVAAQAALFLDDDDAPPPLPQPSGRSPMLLTEADDEDILDDDRDEDEEQDSEIQRRRKQQRLSSLINLASSFLYMTNYNIVAPTTGQYALRVGSSEAMAAIIIGMTPNAALIATVLYCVWSNYSYKSALLFAAGSSILGNIAYAMALHYHSIELVLIGRFLNGFGSARSINRRFIADTFSRAERTAASAEFVTAGALGMAAGPALAVAIAKLDDWTRMAASASASGGGPMEDDNSSSSLSGGSLLWTVETAPGWVMMVLWTIFFIMALWHFEEPDRSHLFGTTAPITTNKSSTIEIEKIGNNANATDGEMQALLASSGDAAKDSSLTEEMKDEQLVEPLKNEPPIYRNIPVMMTLWIYFVLKLVLETLLSSCATLTHFYFGWNSKHTGIFMAFLGLLMFPANLGVARLSQSYQDRDLILGTLMIMLASVLGILSFSSKEYSVIQYILFGICIFVSTNVLEGPNMSLLSKTIPKAWAKGTFNSGFLATEAGTVARSVGDVLISAAASLQGIENLLNAVFVPLLGLVAVSIWGTRKFFGQMVEDDEDDDDDEESSSSTSIKSLSAKNSTTSTHY